MRKQLGRETQIEQIKYLKLEYLDSFIKLSHSKQTLAPHTGCSCAATCQLVAPQTNSLDPSQASQGPRNPRPAPPDPPQASQGPTNRCLGPFQTPRRRRRGQQTTTSAPCRPACASVAKSLEAEKVERVSLGSPHLLSRPPTTKLLRRATADRLLHRKHVQTVVAAVALQQHHPGYSFTATRLPVLHRKQTAVALQPGCHCQVVVFCTANRLLHRKQRAVPLQPAALAGLQAAVALQQSACGLLLHCNQTVPLQTDCCIES